MCYPVLKKRLKSAHSYIIIPGGEKNKNFDSCNIIWQKLISENAGRDAVLINLGGGMVCDLGGFAASVYKRGIDFVHIPTSLLAMVDASIGGKTGIDFMGYKNIVGTFNNPVSVFVYHDFLKTLPPRELNSGFAEIIKHCLIVDEKKFRKVERLTVVPGKMDTWINHSIKIKSDIVKRDPNEKNVRKALNFGHTVGHAIESLFMEDEANWFLHGEAVAAGMIAESFISFEKKLITINELNRVVDSIKNLFQLPLISELVFEKLISIMQQDKKNRKNNSRFTLLNGIGSFKINQQIKSETIVSSLQYYNFVTQS